MKKLMTLFVLVSCSLYGSEGRRSLDTRAPKKPKIAIFIELPAEKELTLEQRAACLSSFIRLQAALEKPLEEYKQAEERLNKAKAKMISVTNKEQNKLRKILSDNKK